MLNNRCPPPLSQPLLDNKDEVVTTMASSEATNTMEYSVLKGKNMKSDNPIFFNIKNFMRLSHQLKSKILISG